MIIREVKIGFLDLALLAFCFWSTVRADEESMQLGILLDTSPEMGFIVPQARKEVRLLNANLEAAGRSPLVVREFSGASLGRPGALSLGATKNVAFTLKKLYEEDKVDLIYWITALGGTQSGNGIFFLEETVKEAGVGKSGERQLIIRNIWQEQIQSGSKWVNDIPRPETDPLNAENFPEEWYSAAKAGKGVIIRSWRLPPDDYRDQFAFPYEFRSSLIRRKMGLEGPTARMDQGWKIELEQKYDLKFMLNEERWLNEFPGRRGIRESTLVPFVSDESRSRRDDLLFAEMTGRESIEEDLKRIEAEKLGVLFGFGFLERDIQRLKSMKNRAIHERDMRMNYMKDLTRIVGETRAHVAENNGGDERVYVSEMVALSHSHTRSAEPGRYARRMADLVRKEGVDAIYFFTNGYTGGGEYGTFEVDVPLVAAAIREAGVRLFVRVPFEFSPIPIELQKLALASGGGVFLGEAGDPDWQVEIPQQAWPEVPDSTESDR